MKELSLSLAIVVVLSLLLYLGMIVAWLLFGAAYSLTPKGRALATCIKEAQKEDWTFATSTRGFPCSVINPL